MKRTIILFASLLGCSSANFDTSDPADETSVDVGDERGTDVVQLETEHETALHDTRVDDASPESSPPDTWIEDTSTHETFVDVIDSTSGSVSFFMPKSSDTRHLVEDPYMGLPGDFLEGSRSTTLSSARRFSGAFDYENNLSGGSLSLDVTINGTKVGTIGPITATPKTAPPATFDFSFAAIAGPTFIIRYTANPSADRLGTIGVHFDVSMVRLDE